MKPIIPLLLLSSVALSRIAFGACSQLTDADVVRQIQAGYAAQPTVNFDVMFRDASVSIDPDLPISSEIASGESVPLASPTTVAICPGGGRLSMSYLAATPSALSNVYLTNVPGVGYQLVYLSANGATSPFPFSQTVVPGDDITYSYIYAGARFGIKLIKTGDIGSNVNVTFGPIGRGQADDGKTVLTVAGGSINIKVLPSCAVSASTLNIDFGTFGPRDVSTTSGPTQPVNFTMLCSGPTPPVSITAALSGTPDTDDPRLLKNTGAQNLAIRLTEPSSGTVLRPNDPNSTLVHTPGGAMQSPYSLDATVLRVGAATPTTGRIQATATITLSIL